MRRHSFAPLRVLPAVGLLAFLASCSSAPQPEPTPIPVPIERESKSDSVATVYVTATTLNVRKDPSTDAAVVAQVRRGDALTLLAAGEQWLQVRLATGESGWVSAKLVSREHPSATATNTPAAKSRSRRAGCPPDSDYRFTKPPTPAFFDGSAHGLVVVEASVDATGTVTSTRIVSNATADPALADVAAKELRSARFAPPIRNCTAKAFLFTYKRSF